MARQAYGDGRYSVEIVPDLGPQKNNAYIVFGPNSGAVTIIDAPAGAEAIIEAIGRRKVEGIVITHAHSDHTAGLATLLKHADVPVYVGPGEPNAPRDAREMEHGKTLSIGGATLRFLHTPGHTPGSISLHFGGAVIVGDTLFPGGPGKTGSNAALKTEIESITKHLHNLAPDTVVLPGHGQSITVQKSMEEYRVFAGRQHAADLHGDVLWAQS